MPPPSLRPSWEQVDAEQTAPGVSEALEGLPTNLGQQLEQGLRSGLESELIDAALNDARQALGEVDRGLADLSEAVRR